jgi:photosystem II stability/assembly factor-like uncharacterized protein
VVHNRDSNVSQFCQRLLATMVLLALLGGLSAAPVAAAAGDNTWRALGSLPEKLDRPVLALAADPADPQVLLAGTPTGNLYRSADGGQTWRPVARHLGQEVLTIAFRPGQTDLVVAGTRGGGVWLSTDAGATWRSAPVTSGRTVRAFGFGPSLIAAGTDRGVLTSEDGSGWSTAGLDQVDVSTLAVTGGGSTPQLVAGGDAGRVGDALPLYATRDGGRNWTGVAATVSASNMVSALAAASTGRVLLGTNGGLFSSGDGGSHWSAVDADAGLPPVDVTGIGLGEPSGGRYYVASDGGGSESGGLWVTRDWGRHFSSLKAPMPSVTGLGVSQGPAPTLFAATFRPGDHAVMLWSYRDAGGTPQGPAGGVAGPGRHGGGGAAQHAATPTRMDGMATLLTGPEGPFLIVSAIALLVLFGAFGFWVRNRRAL